MKVKIEENCKKKFLSQVDPEKTALEELARNWIGALKYSPEPERFFLTFPKFSEFPA
jgi:hypothetical protein